MTTDSTPDLSDRDRPGRLLTVIPATGMTVADVVARLRAADRPDAFLCVATHGVEIRNPGSPCGCMTCDDEDRQVLSAVTGRGSSLLAGVRMILCPQCGNKRCPRATHHDNDCTGSNDPGQPDSAYA